MRAESLAFLTDLVNAPSPSGFERPAAQVYRGYLDAVADRITVDVHGNVTAVLHPDARMRIMLAGHMDEIGYIIHHIDEDGLIYFRAIGGQDGAVTLGQRVWIHGRERVPGVIGSKAVLLDHDSKRPKIRNLWIDIGATSREEAEAVIGIGDAVTVQSEFQKLLGDRATARGFDNKMGCFVIAEALRLLRQEGGLHPEVGVYAVATVQEEIGYRGARTASFAIEAQTGLAIDVDHAIDYPGVDETRYGSLEVGEGPCVGRGPLLSPVTFDLVMRAAREAGIPCQVTTYPGGTGTDANVMQLSRNGMATGLLGVALRYMHTPCEVVSLTDVENCAKLVAAYCRQVRPDTDFRPW